jgi:hypothetical protein
MEVKPMSKPYHLQTPAERIAYRAETNRAMDARIAAQQRAAELARAQRAEIARQDRLRAERTLRHFRSLSPEARQVWFCNAIRALER